MLSVSASDPPSIYRCMLLYLPDRGQLAAMSVLVSHHQSTHNTLLPPDIYQGFYQILLTILKYYSVLTKFFHFRTSFKLAPSINGKEIDLYLLYWLVTAQGGWERVSDVFIFSSISIYQGPTKTEHKAEQGLDQSEMKQ